MPQVPDAEARARELVLLGLRWIEGIDLVELEELADAKRVEAFSSDLVRDGYARTSARRLLPTRAGMLLADGLAARF